MPFNLSAYAKRRPYLYHLTATANLPSLRQSRTLYSAAVLAERAGRGEFRDARRPEHVPLRIGDTVAVLRDQAPLHARNMRLEDGWPFERFVANLNERVFFWPGTEQGPIDYGQRHFARYVAERPIMLRVPFASLTAHNRERSPLFCKYNSGSPRWSAGVPSPRGPNTFLEKGMARFGVSEVVEVTFLEQVSLPRDTEYGEGPAGPWKPLWASRQE